MDPWLQITLTMVTLLALPAGCAMLLKQAGASGWAVVGGVLAGALLGPTLLGRAMPLVHETLFVGGVEQREEMERLIGRHGADLLAAQEAGFDREAIEQLQRGHDEARAELETALAEARWEHQRPLRIFAGLLAGLTLAASGLRAIPRPPDDGEQHIVSAISIGVWSAAMPGSLAYLAALLWWELNPAQSAVIASAVMIGPWALTRIDREAADRAEYGGARMIQSAGRIASLMALAAAAWGFVRWHGHDAWPWVGALAAIVFGWAIQPSTVKPSHLPSDIEPSRSPVISSFAQHCFIPSLAAVAILHVELFAHFAFWPILILLILSGDGRWIGAFLGAMLLGGRGGLRTMRLVLGSMACGPTQLAVVAMAAHLWLIPSQMVMALVIGAVVIEISGSLRRSMARRLTEAEEWELE